MGIVTFVGLPVIPPKSPASIQCGLIEGCCQMEEAWRARLSRLMCFLRKRARCGSIRPKRLELSAKRQGVTGGGCARLLQARICRVGKR